MTQLSQAMTYRVQVDNLSLILVNFQETIGLFGNIFGSSFQKHMGKEQLRDTKDINSDVFNRSQILNITSSKTIEINFREAILKLLTDECPILF